MSYRLIKSDDIKTLSKGEFPGDFDTLLEILIDAVGGIFANYCHRPDFDKKDRTEYFSPGPDQRRIFLASPPAVIAAAAVGPPVVTESPQLWEDTALPRAYGSDVKLVHGEDYFLFENEGYIEKYRGCFLQGPKTVKVLYTGGYLTANAVGTPDDLRLAAMIQTKILWDRREELSLTSRSLEGGAINMLSVLTLPMSVTMILNRYVVPRC